METKVIHHIFTFQAVICIAKRTSQQKRQPYTQRIIAPPPQTEHKCNTGQNRKKHRYRRHRRSLGGSEIQHGAGIVILFQDNFISGTKPWKVFPIRLLNPVLYPQITEKYSCRYEYTNTERRLFPSVYAAL